MLYLEAPNGEKLKITGVSVTYDRVATASSTIISGDELVRAIVKDVKTGQMKMYDRDGRIRDVGSV